MAWVHIAAATLSGNSLRQTVHTYRASVHQAAKLVAALLRVARVTAGPAESNGSLPPGFWLPSCVGWLSTTGISSGTLCSVIEYRIPFTVWTFPCSSVAVYTTFVAASCWTDWNSCHTVNTCTISLPRGLSRVDLYVHTDWRPCSSIGSVMFLMYCDGLAELLEHYGIISKIFADDEKYYLIIKMTLMYQNYKVPPI